MEKLRKFLAFRPWDSSLLVGVAMALMIYSRFYGLGEPFIKALDPYYFWRIAQAIWTSGAWPGPDPLRYWPFGWDSVELAPAMPYTLVYLGKLAGNLKAAVKMYPAIYGTLSVLAMALLGRRLGAGGIPALVLAIVPAYIYRTAHGFADKEPLSFFLGILAWYFIAASLERKDWLLAVYSGISFGMIAAVWGGKVAFVSALIPMFGVLLLKQDTKRMALVSTAWLVYILMNTIVPRYSKWYRDPVSMGIFGIALFGLALHAVYSVPQLRKYGAKRILLAAALGGAVALVAFSLAFRSPLVPVQRMIIEFQNPVRKATKITHSQTVAENQPVNWTWNLRGNTLYSNFGVFFFLAVGYLFVPILRKAWELARGETADRVYAAAMVLAAAWLVKNFTPESITYLFLLGVPHHIKSKDWKGLFVSSITAFSIYAGFSRVRVLIFAATGVALGTAMLLRELLEDRRLGVSLAGVILLAYGVYQVYPAFSANTRALASGSPSITWFENTKWMKHNIPPGTPVVTWWDYGYWMQTLGNTTTLGDGGNVGPGYTLNWYTGHFFATDDYENATGWLDDWNLTYITIDYSMVPKFWAYSTLGGISNVINQLRYNPSPYPSEFGLINIYVGGSDDYGPVAVGELTMGDRPVYLLGRIIGGAIRWEGIVDEFAYFSNQGTFACDPMGYCKSGSFGNFERLNQSIVIYDRQAAFLGDFRAMHSTFARLWFFNGYNTDFRLLTDNGETKNFMYVRG